MWRGTLDELAAGRASRSTRTAPARSSSATSWRRRRRIARRTSKRVARVAASARAMRHMSVSRRSEHVRPRAAVVCRARPTSTSSSTTLEQLRARRDHARSVARVPPGARHLRPAAGRRRADAAREDSAGLLTRDQLDALAESASGTRAASATSRRGRTSSSTSSSCTTSSRRCACSPTPG